MVLGSEQAGLWLQAGFVEGIREEGRSFDTLEDALRHLFRHNLESAILLWNAIPVVLDYTDDVPAIISPLLTMLNTIQTTEQLHEYEFKMFSKNLSANWHIDVGGEFLAICAEWFRVGGDYQCALNSFSTTTVDRNQFICEWKLLLQQCIQAIRDADATFTCREARKKFKLLCAIEAKIPQRGRFYRYTD